MCTTTTVEHSRHRRELGVWFFTARSRRRARTTSLEMDRPGRGAAGGVGAWARLELGYYRS